MLDYYEKIIYLIESILEDNTIDFNKKKNQKIIDSNASDINKMMMSGELDSIRQTPNGNIMGDPAVVNKLKQMKKQTQQAQDELNNQDKNNGN